MLAQQQDILAPDGVGRITENLLSTTQENVHHDGIVSQITEQLGVPAIKSKVNFSLRYLKTVAALCYKPSEVASIVRSGDFGNYINPIHFFCTSLTLLFLSLPFSTLQHEAEGGSGGILNKKCIAILFIIFVIIPACFCGHLCLLGQGRKPRHMVYLQCYNIGIFVLLPAIALGACGIAQYTGNPIDMTINIIAVPVWVGLFWFNAVNWYITGIVYNVSYFRLHNALAVFGLVLAILGGTLLIVLAMIDPDRGELWLTPNFHF
jgi:hypothetical protein